MSSVLTSMHERVKRHLTTTLLHSSLSLALSLSDKICHFLQILQYQAQQTYQNKVVPSAAALFVYVERAHGLPVRTNLKLVLDSVCCFRCFLCVSTQLLIHLYIPLLILKQI